MGMTVQCAACHDHKYDPITQKDYYSLFAFFNNIDAKPELKGLKNGLQPPTASVPTPDQKKALDELGAKMSEVESEINNQNNSEDIISELQEKLSYLKREGQLENQILWPW